MVRIIDCRENSRGVFVKKFLKSKVHRLVHHEMYGKFGFWPKKCTLAALAQFLGEGHSRSHVTPYKPAAAEAEEEARLAGIKPLDMSELRGVMHREMKQHATLKNTYYVDANFTFVLFNSLARSTTAPRCLFNLANYSSFQFFIFFLHSFKSQFHKTHTRSGIVLT